jgi:poly(glycerol-phosphate) alpha-glucosyltransferase
MNVPLAGRRIGLLTASASRLGGGVFEAVVAQAELIRSLGGEAYIFALADRHTDEDRARFGPSTVITTPVIGPPQVGYSPALGRALAAADLDALHLHGIWMYPSAAGAAWANRTGRAYLVSPHGMLDPWITARGRWKKALARRGYERTSWARAHTLHALTPAEARDIAREAGRRDSLVIPNAAPVPRPTNVSAERAPIVLYIGRIHSKKNLLPMVAAWRSLRRPADARLLICGWGAEADVAALTAEIGNADDSVAFLGPVFGTRKAELIAAARFAILPSFSEGLPMAILEAWAHGTPTIMTPQCNLDEGFAAGAALECGYDAIDIVPALTAALALDADHWALMSTAAQALADGPLSAQTVARQWGDAYAAAIAGQRRA